MPRENRKRGKKNKPQQVNKALNEPYQEPHDFPTPHNITTQEVEDSSFDAPFGVLNPDVKAYFRTVDEQLQEWQKHGTDIVDVDIDPNQERRMFFTAALVEMSGKELQLATDPDCSVVLERMLYSMDDFSCRVFMDSLAGSWSQLFTNRFASHVCQTLFTVAASTISRETQGVFPSIPDSEGKGELLTLTQLVLNACLDIVSELSSLIRSPFASHVIRALLLLLAPSQLSSPSHVNQHAPTARSKKSAAWKTRRGPMTPIILDETHPLHAGKGADKAPLAIPETFLGMVQKFYAQFRDGLTSNEVRALAVDKVASPVLQMFLELEAAMGRAEESDSLLDRVLNGFVTESLSSASSLSSPYVSALIMDATSSYLSESILSHCPLPVFHRLWDCYFSKDAARLAVHPVANFVMAKGVGRLDEERLRGLVTELKATWNKALKLSCMGVLTAVIDRTGQIAVHEDDLTQAICSMIGVTTDQERKALVPCLLRLKTLKDYRDALVQKEDAVNSPELSGESRTSRRDDCNRGVSLEPKTQGSILLQAMLRLHAPYNSLVLDSLYSLLPNELLALAQNATGSRVLDAALESPTVSLRSRKQLVTSFIGYFHLLVDSRIGSRVADRCWETADPYLKEKIARSLIPHAQFLAGSHFGRFFTRTLNLQLLQRKPEQWRALQSKDRKLTNETHVTQPKPPGPVAQGEVIDESKRDGKRKRKVILGEDDIDVLFKGVNARKRVRGARDVLTEADMPIRKGDANLDAVLGAIKSAPSDTKVRRK